MLHVNRMVATIIYSPAGNKEKGLYGENNEGGGLITAKKIYTIAPYNIREPKIPLFCSGAFGQIYNLIRFGSAQSIGLKAH